ncbi:flavodoxin domain-containing protein [Cellulomonas sp. PhB150]|uniref:flavodoxin domain-containing protein n=1 Tax=Cellulomonas sp. PhB150 TaxID=2485188 RepID=UPI000F476640|nr:flavodoxin domain-containing protein [Cellulomonas sp. PhB150]ROS30943.1 menaquinone-dependent protoporphyrinogen oxidase [Cellulomonas sp. PhB150]
MHVLVSVASRHGATAEIGEAIALELARAGHFVDVIPPEEVDRVASFDAVVLGSAVYVGRLAVSLRALVQRQAGELRERPVWLFWSGPVGDPPMPVTPPDDVATIAGAVAAREARCFVGSLDRSALGLNERALVALTDAEDGDFRDFDDVRAWASTVAEGLAA